MRHLIAAALLAASVAVTAPGTATAGVGPYDCTRYLDAPNGFLRTRCFKIQPYHCQRAEATLTNRASGVDFRKLGRWRCGNGDPSVVTWDLMTTAHVSSRFHVVTEQVAFPNFRR